MLGPNSVPFMQSLSGGGATLYYSSTWTHSTPPRTIVNEKEDCERKNAPPFANKREKDDDSRQLAVPMIPSRPTSPHLSPRVRASSQIPSSPSLPVISPDAPASRLAQIKSRPSGLWGDLADISFLHTQEFWLGLYFVFNLSLTLYNKGVLVQFPFPYTLTAIHALCGTIGGWSLWAQGAFIPKRFGNADNVALVTFSILYAMNIAVSNVSLNMVTVPFHQVVRASTPIFTIGLSTVMFGTRISSRKLISLIPVILGVGFATYGDYYASVWGFILTLFGTFLAALKTIFTNVLQSSPTSHHSTKSSPSPLLPPPLSLHPLDLLTRMCPLAFIQCIFYAQLSGELDHVREWSAHEMTWPRLTGLLINGCIAFGLNIVSFTANKKAGALSMTVAANIKQVLTILFAVLLFNLSITWMNGVGILFTLAGGAWYGYVDYDEKRRRTERERTVITS